MRVFHGAQWVGPSSGPRVLLLSSEPGSGQRWTYAYSVSPGVVVRLVVMPAPDLPDPADPVYAGIVLGAVGHSAA